MSLVNEKHKYIFIHNPRCAGTSIETAIGFGSSHETIYGYSLRLNIANYFKWCVVRNPYTRLISAYKYIRTNKKLFSGSDELKYFDSYERLILNLDALFDFSLTNYSESITHFLFDHIAPQYYWVAINDDIYIDKILKFEDLTNEIKSVSHKTNINSIPHINTSKKKIDENYYNKKLIEIINRKYAKSFELFGYEIL